MYRVHNMYMYMYVPIILLNKVMFFVVFYF